MQAARRPLGVWLAIALVAALPPAASHAEDGMDAVIADYLARNPEIIEGIVENYLVEHPQVVQNALDELVRRREVAALDKQAAAIERNADLLFNQTTDVALGNPEASVVLVEFYDYNCSYCRQVMPDLFSVLDGDDDLRLILKPLPILGYESFEAALVGAALHRQDPSGASYRQFHESLFAGRGVADKSSAMAIAAGLGADVSRIEADMSNAQILLALDKNRRLADDLGITGTPSFVLGSRIILGAIGPDALRARIEAERQGTSPPSQ